MINLERRAPSPAFPSGKPGRKKKANNSSASVCSEDSGTGSDTGNDYNKKNNFEISQAVNMHTFCDDGVTFSEKF